MKEGMKIYDFTSLSTIQITAQFFFFIIFMILDGLVNFYQFRRKVFFLIYSGVQELQGLSAPYTST